MSARDDQPLHATLIAARRAGLWVGVLLSGPAGAGKSEMALRALAAGWALVADDRVRLWRSGGVVYGAAPDRLHGLLETRGLGVSRRQALRFVRVAAVAHTQAADGERVPEPEQVALAGAPVPLFRLPFLQAGSVARLDLALDAALRRRRAL